MRKQSDKYFGGISFYDDLPYVCYDYKDLAVPVQFQAYVSNFEWGYMGSAPQALAWTILRHTWSKKIADKYAFAFKRDVISQFEKGEPFHLERKDVRKWIRQQIRSEGRTIAARLADGGDGS